MNLILRAGDPLTYRRTLFKANASVASAPSGASWMKLVWTPAPTVTGGNGASCARAGVTHHDTTHARSAGVQRRGPPRESPPPFGGPGAAAALGTTFGATAGLHQGLSAAGLLQSQGLSTVGPFVSRAKGEGIWRTSKAATALKPWRRGRGWRPRRIRCE